MFTSRLPHAAIEPLEARIAPALALLNPLADLTVGPGKTGVDIDLSRMFDPTITDDGHTIVTLHTNFDNDPVTAGIQGDIVIEMLDDEAPLSVQNFLAYLTSADPKTNYANTFFHRSVAGFVVQGGGSFGRPHQSAIQALRRNFNLSHRVCTRVHLNYIRRIRFQPE